MAFRLHCRRFPGRLKLQEKAGKVGFDWNDPHAVLEKIREEIAEVEAEIAEGSVQALSSEVGDLLFAAVNLCTTSQGRSRGCIAQRQRQVRTALRAYRALAWPKRSQTPESASLDEMEQLWVEAKAEERPLG